MDRPQPEQVLPKPLIQTRRPTCLASIDSAGINSGANVDGAGRDEAER